MNKWSRDLLIIPWPHYCATQFGHKNHVAPHLELNSKPPMLKSKNFRFFFSMSNSIVFGYWYNVVLIKLCVKNWISFLKLPSTSWGKSGFDYMKRSRNEKQLYRLGRKHIRDHWKVTNSNSNNRPTYERKFSIWTAFVRKVAKSF